VRFWLERGVDGMRLDAINFCFHDRELRDNPPKPESERTGNGFRADNPYAYQYHHFDNTRPENLAFLEDLRALIDRFPGRVTLGEVSAEDSTTTIAQYTRAGRLHMGYSFELLGRDHSPEHLRRTVEGALAATADAWPCWAISNHDVERVASRWGDSTAPAHLPTLLTALECSLRGSVCVYQGEELGLGEADIPFDSLRDPYGIAFWPTFKGRDGCRTPMPWNDSANGGFSKAAPWLPVPAAHLARSAARQEADPASTLNGFRRFLRWRRAHPALLRGHIEFLHADAHVLAFTRREADEALLVAFNLSGQPASVLLPRARGAQPIDGHGLPSGRIEETRVTLPAWGALYAKAAG